MGADIPGPLHGVKVVEISPFQQRPVADMRLGDLGVVEIINVKAPGGDPVTGASCASSGP
ncbi:hypothetical protein DFAR_2970005 [Desulfarculales bacterium]